jgi:hypothetical protein
MSKNIKKIYNNINKILKIKINNLKKIIIFLNNKIKFLKMIKLIYQKLFKIKILTLKNYKHRN